MSMTRQPTNIVLLALMLTAALLTVALRPQIETEQNSPLIDLNELVPRGFGEWKEIVNISTPIVNPQQKYMLEKIYSQTLSRTYVDPTGYRIMLSIAHGKGQKDGIELHKPELCYPAQGFEIISREKKALTIPGLAKALQTTQMSTRNGQRKEPLIYWTLIGSTVFDSRIQKKLVEIKFSLKKEIPDGMLVRVSSIDNDQSRATQMQTKFLSAWLKGSNINANEKLFGQKLNAPN